MNETFQKVHNRVQNYMEFISHQEDYNIGKNISIPRSFGRFVAT